MQKPNADILQGTLDLLILKTLSLEPMHGWAIAQRIKQTSGEVFSVNQGSLYPALYRLEHNGWITAGTGVAENGREVKVYRLTRAGLSKLDQERESWTRITAAVARVLEA